MANHPKDIISCEKGGRKVMIFRKDSGVYSGKGYVINEDDIVKAFEAPEEESLPSVGPDVSDPLPDGIIDLPETPGLSENP